MVVNYKLVSGGSYSLLFDESAGDANERFMPAFVDKVYKPAGYGAPNISKVPQENTDGTTTFKWSSNYSTADAALAAIATLRSTFKGIPVHLEIIQGTTTLYLPNANLTGSSHDPRGRECGHQLTFTHDDITTVAP